MRSLHEVKGIVTQIIPGNKCVVAFSAFGSSQMGVLPGNNLKTVGTVSSDVLLCNLLMVGSKLCFSCHEFGSKADHEYDWYITNAWLINDSSIAGRTPGVFLGLYNCSGKVQKLQNRLGVLCFRDHNETEHLVLFLASKCFIRGKRINAKQSLSTVLSEEDMLLFDAVPCIPEENEFGCDWFATFVWLQGPRPHDYNTSSAPGLSPTSLLLQYKMIASCPRSLFVRGKGQVLKIVNNEYGTALMSVQMLDMSHCNISRLPKETFVALSALEELRLSYNSLTQLDADLFMFLQNLKYLYMSNNNLSYIPQDLFMYSEFLQVLDISQNKLKELESFIFHHQIYLEVLYLNFNQLTSLHENLFHSLGNLTELYLQNNSIEAIENDVFGSTANLRLLYLDNNSMENITREALASLESLSHLYISNNHLRTFHMRLVCDLPSLKYLRVYGNPMSCSCELKTLWEWAMYRGIQLWGSCTPEGSDEVLSNSSAAVRPELPLRQLPLPKPQQKRRKRLRRRRSLKNRTMIWVSVCLTRLLIPRK